MRIWRASQLSSELERILATWKNPGNLMITDKPKDCHWNLMTNLV